MKKTAEDAVKRIRTNSARISVNRHIVISVVAFGGSTPKELKLLSDACNGLYYLINVENDPDLIEDTAESLANIIGSSRGTVANDITVNIQANDQVISLAIIYRIS